MDRRDTTCSQQNGRPLPVPGLAGPGLARTGFARTGLARDVVRVLALATALGATLGAAAALADPAPTATVTAPGSAAGRQILAATESHIADLHARLHITAAEEPAWNSFAGVMRQNALDLTAKLDQRQQAFATMNAVQDLTSYADVTELHAQQITKLVAPFQALYDDFDPQQKQTADRIFHTYAQKTGRSR